MKTLILFIAVFALLAVLAMAAESVLAKAVSKKPIVGAGTETVCREPSRIAPNTTSTTDTTAKLGGAGGNVCITTEVSVPDSHKHSVTTTFTPDPEIEAELAHVKVEAHSVIITGRDYTWRIELPRAGHVPISDELFHKMETQKWPTPEQGLNEEMHRFIVKATHRQQ